MVAGFEKSGKSTTTSKLRKSLVFNFDAKEYGFRAAHTNMKEYDGMKAVLARMSEKIKLFKHSEV